MMVRSILLLALVGISLSGCDSIVNYRAEKKGLELCEAKLMEKLRVPSSYKRVSYTFGQSGPFSKQDFRDVLEQHVAESEANGSALDFIDRYVLNANRKSLASDAELEKAYRNSFNGTETKSFISVIYDAENLMGAAPRAAYMCVFRNDANRIPSGVMVNGSVERNEAEKAI